jgi:hypothetical protein
MGLDEAGAPKFLPENAIFANGADAYTAHESKNGTQRF